MRSVAAAIVVALSLASSARAETDEIKVSFVSLDASSGVTNDVVDVGSISRRVTRRIGIRIESSVGGSVMLRAWLENPDARCRIRLNGLDLGAMPRVISAAAPIGQTVSHRIEIDVPVDAPEGAISSEIAWEVIRN